MLISPLWAIIRYGWASSQLGNVFVENREWTSASARRGALVLQVGVVAAELRRGQHPLVDDRARGEARDDRVGAALELEPAADHVELALERVLVGDAASRGRDDELPDERRGRGRGAAGELPGRPGRRASRRRV